MKSKTLVLMVVAVVCGLAASYMTSRLLADRNEQIQVLVAKQKFNAWTPIKSPEDQFDLEERARSEVPKSAVLKLENVKDRVLIKGMDKGDVVVAENLMSKDKGGLEVLLPPGTRAVAVRTTAEVVAGGFVLPGSHVDVIHSIKRGDRESETKVILQNILVRAVDTMSFKPEDKPGLVPATVTLQVTPQQSVVLSQLKDSGTITFALRPYGDDTMENLAPPPVVKPVVVPKPAVVIEPPVDRKTLLIQNGSQWTRATYTTKNGETETTIDGLQGASPPAPGALASAKPEPTGSRK